MDKAPNVNPQAAIRSPSLKRRSRPGAVSKKVSLEKVIGLTTTTNAALSVDPATSTCAYSAGCIVVLLDTVSSRQSHIFNQSKKAITCVAYCSDGRHVATGESGHEPMLRVWDTESEDKTQVCAFAGHKFSISCVGFAPNQKYLVSIGNEHDMVISVWNWRNQTKLASNKVSSKVYGLAFSEDSSYFVTVGNRHVRFWYIDMPKSKIKETVPLSGRNGLLGDLKNNSFTGVCCGTGDYADYTYTVTQSGLLCQFNSRRVLERYVELRTSRACCVSNDELYLYVGCAAGIVRVFSIETLEFVTTLPRPHHFGVNVSEATDVSYLSQLRNADLVYPDCTACVCDYQNNKLICVYKDHSLYVWDIKDVRKCGKVISFLSHSSSIWGLEILPDLSHVTNAPVMPPDCFMTCASDDTIRIWTMNGDILPSDAVYQHNIYSDDLLKVIYYDSSYTNMCDLDPEMADKSGIRSVAISCDGQYLASGDRVGNLRIHRLPELNQIHDLAAHDGEIICVEFSKVKSDLHILATASRDRLIHLFDVNADFSLLQTLDDHSSSITAVRFCKGAITSQLRVISCAADKSVLFRASDSEQNSKEFQRDHYYVGKTTLYDLEVDPRQQFVVTACQDRNVRIHSVKTGQIKKTYKGCQSEDGFLNKLHVDPSGSFVITSSSEKDLNILDFYTGECVATMFGHSEITLGVKFTNDLRHAISVGADGCIFIWKLSPTLTYQMHQRMVELGLASGLQGYSNVKEIRPETGTKKQRSVRSEPVKKRATSVDLVNENKFPVKFAASEKQRNEPDPSVFNSDGHSHLSSSSGLPSWAAKQVTDEPRSGNSSGSEMASRRKWGPNPSTDIKIKSETSSPDSGQDYSERVCSPAVNWEQYYPEMHVKPAGDEYLSRYASPSRNQLARQRMSLPANVLKRGSTNFIREVPVSPNGGIDDEDDDEDELFANPSVLKELHSPDDSVPAGLIYHPGLPVPESEQHRLNKTVIYYPAVDSDAAQSQQGFRVFSSPQDAARLKVNRRQWNGLRDSQGSGREEHPESGAVDSDEEFSPASSVPGTPQPGMENDPFRSNNRFVERSLNFDSPSQQDELPPRIATSDRFVSPRLSLSHKFLESQSESKNQRAASKASNRSNADFKQLKQPVQTENFPVYKAADLSGSRTLPRCNPPKKPNGTRRQTLSTLHRKTEKPVVQVATRRRTQDESQIARKPSDRLSADKARKRISGGAQQKIAAQKASYLRQTASSSAKMSRAQSVLNMSQGVSDDNTGNSWASSGSLQDSKNRSTSVQNVAAVGLAPLSAQNQSRKAESPSVSRSLNRSDFNRAHGPTEPKPSSSSPRHLRRVNLKGSSKIYTSTPNLAATLSLLHGSDDASDDNVSSSEETDERHIDRNASFAGLSQYQTSDRYRLGPKSILKTRQRFDSDDNSTHRYHRRQMPDSSSESESLSSALDDASSPVIRTRVQESAKNLSAELDQTVRVEAPDKTITIETAPVEPPKQKPERRRPSVAELREKLLAGLKVLGVNEKTSPKPEEKPSSSRASSTGGFRGRFAHSNLNKSVGNLSTIRKDDDALNTTFPLSREEMSQPEPAAEADDTSPQLTLSQAKNILRNRTQKTPTSVSDSLASSRIQHNAQKPESSSQMHIGDASPIELPVRDSNHLTPTTITASSSTVTPHTLPQINNHEQPSLPVLTSSPVLATGRRSLTVLTTSALGSPQPTYATSTVASPKAAQASPVLTVSRNSVPNLSNQQLPDVVCDRSLMSTVTAERPPHSHVSIAGSAMPRLSTEVSSVATSLPQALNINADNGAIRNTVDLENPVRNIVQELSHPETAAAVNTKPEFQYSDAQCKTMIHEAKTALDHAITVYSMLEESHFENDATRDKLQALFEDMFRMVQSKIQDLRLPNVEGETDRPALSTSAIRNVTAPIVERMIQNLCDELQKNF